MKAEFPGIDREGRIIGRVEQSPSELSSRNEPYFLPAVFYTSATIAYHARFLGRFESWPPTHVCL
jgi:hypothetical protein